jgi:hypothetical protein
MKRDRFAKQRSWIDQETHMFPDAKNFLGKSRLMELGAELEARKQQLEKSGTCNRPRSRLADKVSS